MRSEAGLPWVLLAEDNSDDEQLFRRAFRPYATQFELRVATTGPEAVDLLKEEPLPVVAFLDTRMPLLDGFGVLKWIRSEPRLNSLPVLVVSSATELAESVGGYELGVSSFIQKPVDFDEYMTTVKTVLDYWLTVNRNPRPPVA